MSPRWARLLAASALATASLPTQPAHAEGVFVFAGTAVEQCYGLRHLDGTFHRHVDGCRPRPPLLVGTRLDRIHGIQPAQFVPHFRYRHGLYAGQ